MRYEIYGQCDLVMLHDTDFAEGLGLDMHIRTKIAGSLSYIKSVSIRIGKDVLEIEGSPLPGDEEAHYWINSEYRGELTSIAGFPVERKQPTPYKQQYTIDLDSKYPGRSITFDLFKEFIRFKLNGDELVFGNSVGLLGDYKTGKNLARDGDTELHDYIELSDEWQVLPSEPQLFRQLAHPQFPENCIRQENPLDEDQKAILFSQAVPVEEAETACSAVLDERNQIKNCISYVMAGRDLNIVGEFLVLNEFQEEPLL